MRYGRLPARHNASSRWRARRRLSHLARRRVLGVTKSGPDGVAIRTTAPGRGFPCASRGCPLLVSGRPSAAREAETSNPLRLLGTLPLTPDGPLPIGDAFRDAIPGYRPRCASLADIPRPSGAGRAGLADCREFLVPAAAVAAPRRSRVRVGYLGTAGVVDAQQFLTGIAGAVARPAGGAVDPVFEEESEHNLGSIGHHAHPVRIARPVSRARRMAAAAAHTSTCFGKLGAQSGQAYAVRPPTLAPCSIPTTIGSSVDCWQRTQICLVTDRSPTGLPARPASRPAEPRTGRPGQ